VKGVGGAERQQKLMTTCLSRRGWVRPVAEAPTRQHNMCDTQGFGRVLAGVAGYGVDGVLVGLLDGDLQQGMAMCDKVELPSYGVFQTLTGDDPGK
jgi:hypothetical protein